MTLPRAESLLKVVPDVFLSQSESGNDLLHRADGSWLELAPVQATAAEVFSLPRTLASGTAAIRKRHAELDPADARAIVIELIENGIVAPHELGARPAVSRPTPGMYSAPMTTLEQAVAGESSDVVLLGMPYDLGVSAREGTRGGPSYFRRASRTAFEYVEKDGRPSGWFDSKKQQRVLEGVRLCDIGDISVGNSARNGVAFDKLHETVTCLLRARRFPVTIGGDHSIALPCITAAASIHPGLGVLHFDAHPDRGSLTDMGDWKRNCSHGNFMSWVISNPDVSSVHQFGPRHLLTSVPAESPKVKLYPGNDFVGRIHEIVDAIPNDRPYYLTFDVDCLDPQVISQTGTPIPGGLEYREAFRALEVLSKRLNIVGMDVVELTGADDVREGVTMAYLVFELLANVFARGRR